MRQIQKRKIEYQLWLTPKGARVGNMRKIQKRNITSTSVNTITASVDTLGQNFKILSVFWTFPVAIFLFHWLYLPSNGHMKMRNYKYKIYTHLQVERTRGDQKRRKNTRNLCLNFHISFLSFIDLNPTLLELIVLNALSIFFYKSSANGC